MNTCGSRDKPLNTIRKKEQGVGCSCLFSVALIGMVPVRACSQLISITPVPMVMVAGVSVPLYLQARCQGLAGSGPVQEDKGVYFLAKGQKNKWL